MRSLPPRCDELDPPPLVPVMHPQDDTAGRAFLVACLSPCPCEGTAGASDQVVPIMIEDAIVQITTCSPLHSAQRHAPALLSGVTSANEELFAHRHAKVTKEATSGRPSGNHSELQ